MLESGRDKIPSRARRKVQPGDIVYSTVRPNQKHFGLLKDVPENFLASTGFAVLRGKENIADTGFLYWFLAQNRIVDYLHSVAENSTSAYPSIRPSDIGQLRLTLPPLTEQRAIAYILGTLDDKIELNRRMNKTMEAMAQALFKSWFVDYEPVRAKMEGRDTCLSPEIASLFPNQLVPSVLGEIPEAWPLTPLSELVEINPPRPMRNGQMAPYLDMANMPTRGHVPETVLQRPYGSGMKFANGDTLLARITPCLENGKTAFVDFLREDEIGWGSTEYIVMTSLPPLPKEFAYCLARSTALREYAVQNMSGTSGRQRVSVTALKRFMVPSPSVDLALEFGRIAKTLLERASRAIHETRLLSSLRDSVLPKLISGRIRVGELQRNIRSRVFIDVI